MFRKWMLMTCATAIVVSALGTTVNAIGSTATTYLTFDSAVAIPGTTLRPGTYIIERADTAGRSDIVRVLSRDRSRVYLTQFTRVVARPAQLPDNRVVDFAEAAPGTPAPIRVWYPVGESVGHQFIYPRS